ncbi:MAG: GAF domain-containing protein, partial [Spirochaetes bacterium]|nr:GAF domain-containing protein [Spirochaetota bacterium]
MPKTALGTMLGFTREVTIQLFHIFFPKVFINDKHKNDEQRKIGAKIYMRLAYCYYFIDLIKSGYAGLKSMNLVDKIAGTYEFSWLHSTNSSLWSALGAFSFGEKYIKGGLETALRIKDKIMEGFAYAYFCFLYYAWNQVDRAIENGLKARDLLIQYGERWDIGVAYVFTGWSYMLKGELEKAVIMNKEYLDLMKDVKDLRTQGWSLYLYAHSLILTQGVNEDCIAMIKEALKYEFQVKEVPHIVRAHSDLVFAYTRQKKFKKAIELGENGAKILLSSPARGMWALVIFAYTADAYLTSLEEEKVSFNERKKYLKRAYFMCKQAMKWGRLFKVYFGLGSYMTGKYFWLKGEKKRAIDSFTRAINFLKKYKYNYELAVAYYELGKFLFKEGYSRNYGKEKGKEYLLKAKEFFSEMGASPDLQRTLDLLGEETKKQEVDTTATQQDRLQLERRMTTVLNTSRYLSSILDLDELLEKIMDRTIELVGAERGLLLLYPDKDEGKPMELETKVVRGVKSDESSTFTMSKSILKKVIESRKPLIIDDASTNVDLKTQASIVGKGFKSVLCAPIVTKNELLGVVYLDNHLVSGLFKEEDLRILELISSQAGVSIENARLYKKSIIKERIEQDMEIAGTIQKLFLPEKIEVIKKIAIDAYYSPAEFIGGDYYDVVKIDKDR